MSTTLPVRGTPAPTAAAASVLSPPAERLDAVDLLRGLVMVLMALDHTRDYFHFGELHGYNPLDLATTTVPLFFTRWITHFCAPVFIFLAGTGAFLALTRGKSKREQSWFLVTRGLWLILLELTVIKWAGWSFAVNLHLSYGIVIWAIGWSMIVLAALIHLPLWAAATFGLAMILGHNALDGIRPESWGAWSGLWKVLHSPGPVEFAPGYVLFAAYSLIPWTGVMAAGYAFGAVLQRPREARRRWFVRAGFAAIAAFVVLRFTNVYGNPSPWTTQRDATFTVLSFLNCNKYPPSVCYLLMTLGPAMLALAALDREVPSWLRPIRVFGRVPLFYYLLHIPLVHGMAVLYELIRAGHAGWLLGDRWGVGAPPAPPDAGVGLLGVYLAWLLAVVLLYPACRWFADLKRRRRDAWLSYL